MSLQKGAAASASLAPAEGVREPRYLSASNVERDGVRCRNSQLRRLRDFSLSAFGGEGRGDVVPNRKSAIRNRTSPGLPFNSNRNYEVFWGKTKEKPVFEECQD